MSMLAEKCCKQILPQIGSVATYKQKIKNNTSLNKTGNY